MDQLKKWIDNNQNIVSIMVLIAGFIFQILSSTWSKIMEIFKAYPLLISLYVVVFFLIYIIHTAKQKIDKLEDQINKMNSLKKNIIAPLYTAIWNVQDQILNNDGKLRLKGGREEYEKNNEYI